GGTLTIDASRGSIEVRGSGRDSVDVEVLREVRSTTDKIAREILDDYIVKFDQSGDNVKIKAEFKTKKSDRVRNKLRVKFVVTVPNRYNVDLHTSGGSLSVEDLTGKVLTRTSGGSMKFDGIDGPIDGKTSGGSITIGDTTQSVKVHTSGGSIKIDRAGGEVDATTSGGSITVNEVKGKINANTSGGSVKAYISKQPESDCTLKTSGGTVTVYLEEGIGVHVDAHTSGGRISTDFPIKIKGEISRRDLDADVNGGGPLLYLRSSGGSIHIKKK
ncbi:DUF4097 domain-containing protein, partial [Acidobacteriota bacterium]